MNSKVAIYLLIYFGLLRFGGTCPWVSVNVSAYCRYMRNLKGYLHVRFKAISPWPFVYAEVLGRLTMLLDKETS